MLMNPVVLSVLTMIVLCLLKLNVIFSLIIAAIVGGLSSGMSLSTTMSILVGGMGGNSETALSYILLGTLAAAIQKTGAAEALSIKIAQCIKGNRVALFFIFALVACMSGTVIPVHIAFIPILIPPLLQLMDKLRIDRRGAACALAFGLKAPYITFPIGYGLIYHGIVKDQMIANGMPITLDMVGKATWIGGLAMLTGFIISLFTYRKPRDYGVEELSEDQVAATVEYEKKDIEVASAHWIALVAGASALAIQLKTGSLPLGAIVGIAIMLITKSIRWNELDELLNEGLKMMALVAFIMLVAAGYACVIRETGGVERLVSEAAGVMGGSKLISATIMLLLGLLITMGIGTSFGTVPILAVIYVPLASALGFSVKATIILIAIASAIGDAGSPASDTTLGPTSGLNADGKHDHIWDTSVPTFLHYSVPLFLFGLIGVLIF